MTNLERLIKAHVEGTTLITISSATERIAEEMARELVKSPEFRADLQELIRKHFKRTTDALVTDRPRRRRKG